MKLTYAEQLRHPMWQRRRLERLQAAGWACEACQATEYTLHVHHRQYFKGRMAWEYADHELAVLCEHCHLQEHFEDEFLKRMFALVPIGMSPISNASAVLSGYFGSDVDAVAALADDVGVHTRLRIIGSLAASLRAVPEVRLPEVQAFIQTLIADEKSNG